MPDRPMDNEEISRIVETVVGRVVRRLEAMGGSDAPQFDEAAQARWRDLMDRAIELGAVRIFPQALSAERCADLAARIEQTLLRPDARESEVRRLCREAVERGYCAVCLGLEWTEVAASELKGSPVKLAVPVGFPTGGLASESKAAEARRAVALGADEIDVVINLSHVRAADWRSMLDDLRCVVEASQGRPVKAVIEAALLTAEQKAAASILAAAAGAAFVKSSTGFGPDGVTLRDVVLVRAALRCQAHWDSAGGADLAARIGAVVSVEVPQVSPRPQPVLG